MKFSLIIPCYNESKSIPQLLEKCLLLTQGCNIEVILVDNGSTDESPEVLATLLPQYPGCRSIRVEVNQGYGYGITSGLQEANGDILGWTNADLQTDPIDILQGIALFDRFGSKIMAKGRRYGRPLSDTLFTAGMSLFETLLFKRLFWDINAQPNIFHRDFFESLDDMPRDFSLDLYALVMAVKNELRIRRINVEFLPRNFGRSKWNMGFKSKIRFIKRTMKYSLELRRILHEDI